MSREDDVGTVKLDLGPCECAGSPHESDWAIAKDRLSYGDVRRVVWGAEVGGGLGQQQLAVRALLEWNLTTTEKGKTVPLAISGEAIDDLTPRQAGLLLRELNREDYLLGGPLPNPSGAPSPSGRAAASSTSARSKRTPPTRS